MNPWALLILANVILANAFVTTDQPLLAGVFIMLTGYAFIGLVKSQRKEDQQKKRNE